MAYNYDIKIEQGATFTMRLRVSNTSLNLVGATARGMVRQYFTDAAPVLTFTATIGSDSEGYYIDVTATATETAAIVLTTTGPTRKKTKCAYDIELVLADNTVIRLLEGIAEISPEATK